MAYSKNRRLADLITANAEQFITSAHVTDAAIVPGDLHATLDLTGKTITVANASTGDSDTTVANTAFVQQEIAALVDSSPSALNTLNELAAALGDDANFSTTVTNSIATKLPLAGGTMTGDLILGDNVKLEVGSASGGDLQIYHDGSNSYIAEGGTGDLLIRTNGTGIRLQKNNGEHMIKALTDGAVLLYYDNQDKLETTSTGVTVTGTLTSTNLTIADGVQEFDKPSVKGFRFLHNDAGNDLSIQQGDTNNANYVTKFNISTDGNIGIGTTSPAKPLHISSADNQPLRVESTDAYSGIELKDNGSATLPPLISALSDDFIFYGGHASSRPAIMFMDSSSGNVGIGTNSPATQLQLLNAGQSMIRMGYSTTQYGQVGRNSDGTYEFSCYENGGVIKFGTSTSNNATTTRMQIDSTGRVGINRAPSKSNSKLEVGGADNVGLIHVEASGNFASWGIGSNQSKFYYNDTQMMGLTNEGVMKLMGGVDSGRQDLVFNNGYRSITNESTYTLSGVLNTGALISIGVNRSNVGVTYDHCLIFAELGTAATIVANPSGRIAINSATTANKVNVFVNGNSVVIQNKVASTVTVSIAAIVFQGN